MSFLKHFDNTYSKKLHERAHTFRKIFEILENKHKEFYYIIETGCTRRENNFVGDGMSTVLFDSFVNYYDGLVESVDIDKKHCNLANNITSEKTKVTCNDSVKFLWDLVPKFNIDLLYLDSFDIELNKPHPSMLHHMKEFCAVINKLNKGTLIVIDDHFNEESGKGVYISNFMKNLGHKRFIDGYQIGWIL